MTVYAPAGSAYHSISTPFGCRHIGDKLGYDEVGNVILTRIAEVTCSPACEEYLRRRHHWLLAPPEEVVEPTTTHKPLGPVGTIAQDVVVPISLVGRVPG